NLVRYRGVGDVYKIHNKKRMAALALFLLWFLRMDMIERDDVFGKIAGCMVPLLTYEQEYGSLEVDYASDYQVPAWFYEDESEKPVNGDLALAAMTAEEQRVASITTLADGTGGTVFTREQLSKPEFLLNKIFVVDSNTSMTAEELDLTNLLDKDLSIDNLKAETSPPAQSEAKQYKILIYHTHGSESFADSRAGEKEDTIIGVGSYLTRLLEEQYGIPVYHDETAYDVIDGALDRSKAYENAYNSVSKILQENPSIEVVIDLHRDGVNEDTHLVTEVNGKPTAKIMFLNGVSRSDMNGEIEYLKNPNKLTNLAFSFQMYLTGKEHYGDYVRKIYVRSLRYNLHLLPRTALIEVGAQNNTVEEEKNAMEPLAAILDKVLSKKE
ncbi:MAG: stage II sporulation protein P, partial [Lachnospiraceae bacterium]|nr:stage II sporulation protein P [Lachnospiraceae bacterium]